MADSAAGDVLLVEDDPTVRMLLARWLEREGHVVTHAESAEEGLAILERWAPDVVCMDLNLPGRSGLEALDEIRARLLSPQVIILTADREVETVVSAVQRGAVDYLPKPVEHAKLVAVVRAAVARARLASRAVAPDAAESSGALLGESPAMRALFRQIERVAASDVTVLVHGESGTGKELVARAIHAGSGRRRGPFIALNCAAIPEALQESEFFGHERGAFTGALATRKGRFELAHGGTLFLDEVAELGVGLQAKLLRVLQERSFQRVGGTAEVRSDFRLVAATHRNLADLVAAGAFRSDLYFRLAVFELDLPALRDRSGDVLLLAHKFLHAFGQGRRVVLSDDAKAALEQYSWPGNVRELENAMQRALVVAHGDRVTAADLPLRVARAGDAERDPSRPSSGQEPVAAPASAARPSDAGSLEEVERRALEKALAQTGGNVSEAVRILGIGRSTAYRMMKRYGLR